MRLIYRSLPALIITMGFSLNILAQDNENLSFESLLDKVLSHIEEGDIQSATQLSKELATQYPQSSVAQLLHADFQSTQAMDSVSMASDKSFSRELVDILNEIKVRKRYMENPIHGKIPDFIIQASPLTKHIIAVDLSLSRLFLLERQTDEQFIITQDHYISIGLGGIGKKSEGDLKTPIGIYNINRFKTDKSLPRLYGTGAFTLDFPNQWDKKHDINGSGIWLHGIPHDQLSRPPLTSEGCVVMQNEILTNLHNLIDWHTTPVILSQSIQWIDPSNSTDTLSSKLKDQLTKSSKYPLKSIKNLQILSYPNNNNDKPIYQVRFLHETSSTDNHLVTQYWKQISETNFALFLEDS